MNAPLPGSLGHRARPGRRLAALFVGWVCLGLGLGGCRVYDEDLLNNSNGCDLTQPNPRPSIPDDGVDIGEVSFALREIVFEQRDTWQMIGYDLDDRCSTPTNGNIECQPIDRSSLPQTDGQGGIDNTFGHMLFPLLSIGVPNLQQQSQASQEQGNGSVLIRINGWNGERNDPKLDVVVGITVFGTPEAAPGQPPPISFNANDQPVNDNTGQFPAVPRWDGNDYFWLRDDNFVTGDPSRPVIRDNNAYISDGLLVITLPERTDFIFPGQGVGVVARLTDAVLTGQLNEDGTALLPVTAAGRWALNDLLSTAESIGVCMESDTYDALIGQLDRLVDVKSTSGTGGADVDCDAVSVGITFNGYRANFGGIAPGPEPSNACELMRMDGGMMDGGADAGAEASMPESGMPDGGMPDGG
ncbi:MAG: hypothetical protein AAGF12_24745 [Myxococcota bacterium]